MHFLMMMRQTMFGEIGIQISYVRFPKDVLMSLSNSILYSIKSHIHGFCELLLHLVVDDNFHSGVLILRGCGRLGVAHFFRGGSDWFTVFVVVEQFPHFYLH